MKTIINFLVILLLLLTADYNFVFADAVDDHIRMLQSYDDDQRKGSAKALSNYHDPRAVNALLYALNDPEDEVVVEAVRSLGFIGDSAAVEPLIAKLTDPESEVRATAAEALGRIGDPRAIAPLENMLNTDWNPFLKGLVSDAITKCRMNIGKTTYTTQTTVTSIQTTQTAPSKLDDNSLEPVLGSIPVEKIAILPFKDTAVGGSTTGYGEAVSEMITTSFISTKIFEVIERAQIKKILEEQQFSISGSVDSDTAIELGRLLGVKYLVIGSVAHLGHIFEIDVRMIQTDSGKGVIAESATSNGEINLRNTVNTITDKLVLKYAHNK